MPKINVLVTAVGAPPGLSVLNSLKDKKDLKIIACDSDPYARSLYEKTYIGYILPSAKEEKKYISSLLKIIHKEKVRVVLPCVEEEVMAISKNAHIFNKIGVVPVVPKYDVLMQLSDKRSLVSFTKRSNLMTPNTWRLDKFELNNKHKTPLIIKPRMGHGARGLFIARDKKDLFRIVNNIERSKRKDYIVQEYIPGKEGSIYMCGILYNKEGKIITMFLSRSLKTLYDFGGPAVVGESMPRNHPINAIGRKFAENVKGWFGPLAVEFKVHATTGVPYILEVNPRFWGYSYLATKCGLNFPYLSIKIALNKKVSSISRYTAHNISLRKIDDIVIPKKKIKGGKNAD